MSFVQSKLGQNEVRSWGDFFDSHRFKLPENTDVAFQRALTNFNYYAVNYIIIGLLFLFITIIFRPLLLLVLIPAIGGVGFIYSKKSTMDDKTLLTYFCILAGVSSFLSILLGGIPVIFMMTIAGFFVLLHAFLRCRSTKSKLAAHMSGIQTEVAGGLVKDVAKELVDSLKRPKDTETLIKGGAEAVRARFHQTQKAMKEKYGVEDSV